MDLRFLMVELMPFQAMKLEKLSHIALIKLLMVLDNQPNLLNILQH